MPTDILAVGYVKPGWRLPSFVTPVFNLNGRSVVQGADARGVFVNWLDVTQEEVATIAPREAPDAKKTRWFGFAYSARHSDICLGSQTTLSGFFQREKSHSLDPLVASHIARFVGDEAGAMALETRFLELTCESTPELHRLWRNAANVMVRSLAHIAETVRNERATAAVLEGDWAASEPGGFEAAFSELQSAGLRFPRLELSPLVADFLKSDRSRDAWGQLFRYCYFLVRRIDPLLSVPDIEDVVSGTIQSFFRRLSSESFATATRPPRLSTLLYALLHHRIRDAYRARRPERKPSPRSSEEISLEALESTLAAPSESAEEIDRQSWSASLVQEALRRVAERHPRSDLIEVLRLSYFSGFSTKKAAEMLGLTPAAFRSRKARALKALQRELQSMKLGPMSPTWEGSWPDKSID